jgi:hypothetical protein
MGVTRRRVIDRRTPRVEGRRSGARAIGKNTSLRYEWPELMISQRDGYHHQAHSYLHMTHQDTFHISHHSSSAKNLSPVILLASETAFLLEQLAQKANG